MKKSFLFLFAFITLCSLSKISNAQTPGSLDLTFNEKGYAINDFGNSNDYARSVAIQADGKILVAGHITSPTSDIVLARYNVNGSLDNTFGIGGKVITSIGVQTDELESIALQQDGKIIVAGSSSNNTDYSYDLFVARYNTNGTLDNTFNSIGYVTKSIESYDDNGFCIIIQNDGKIVCIGESAMGPPTYNSKYVALRYNANG